ncbi:MAG: SDR family oxidoreductase [Rhodospirillaceae bacterium]|nr:SDR family oxidoreductase [Rhodospirillaceae bacterium]
MASFQGKTAIVTGTSAARGIGRATAVRLAVEGAFVVVTDLQTSDNTAALNDLVQEIEATGGEAISCFTDVTKRDEIDHCVETAIQRFGSIDILVNNAGTTIGARPFLEITKENWEISFSINLRGVADFCQAVIPGMIQMGGGSIINNASTAGLGAEAGFGAYNATKHGLVGLTKTIAAEFGVNNIRCNAVCPGLIKTDMHLGANERLAREHSISVEEMAVERYQAIALKRAAEPNEVADVIAFLAGPAASFVTGTAIPVAGGQSAGL